MSQLGCFDNSVYTILAWNVPNIKGTFPILMELSQYSWNFPNIHRTFPVFMERSRYSWNVPDIHGTFPIFMELSQYLEHKTALVTFYV